MHLIWCNLIGLYLLPWYKYIYVYGKLGYFNSGLYLFVLRSKFKTMDHKIVTGVRQMYQDQHINREKQWPPCHLNKVVRLELVEKEVDNTANQWSGQVVKRIPLAYGDLFKYRKKPITKILVEGDAGIGKTTLCTSISEDWANGRLFQQFYLLLLLPLCHKEVASADSLSELLKLLGFSANVCDSLEEDRGEKICIIADGWDELGASEWKKESFLCELLFGDLPNVSVVLTTRPASAPLHKHTHFDRVVEMCGFNKENIKGYILSEFSSDDEKVDHLIKQLKSKPSFESMCSIPLNCAMICHLWHTLEEVLPTTLTDLYTKMCLNLILHTIQKTDAYSTISYLGNFDVLPPGLQQSWWFLCKFALQAIERGQTIFSREELVDLFPQGSVIPAFGLLRSTVSVFEVNYGISYNFVHLTFQEFLAALHIAQQPTETQVRVLNKLNENSMVWRFFFGILFGKREPRQIKGKESHVYIQHILSNTGTKSLHVLSHCMLEAGNKLINNEVDQNLCNYSFGCPNTAHDCAAVIYVIANMQECSEIVINFSNCGVREEQIIILADVLASRHNNIWIRELNLSHNKLSDKCMSVLFHRATAAFQSLEKLYLGGNLIETETLTELLMFRSLSLLDLSHNPLGISELQVLVDAICSGKLINLKSLFLQGSLTDNADDNGILLANLMKAFSVHCHHLSTFDVSNNNLGVPGSLAVGKNIHTLQLICLNLNETKLSDGGLSTFVERLSLESTICHAHKLELMNNCIHGRGVSYLTYGICSGMLACSELYLDDNPLQFKGAIAISRMLSSSNCRLSRLSLSSCQLTTLSVGGGPLSTDSTDDLTSEVVKATAQHFCQISQNSAVTWLDLDDNNFSGEGIHILAGFMYLCPNLQYLSSNSCGIISDDFTQLLDRLLKEVKAVNSSLCKKLQSWDLEDNEIDNNAVSVLLYHIPSLFPNIYHGGISLHSNPVSVKMMKSLKKELNRCREVTESQLMNTITGVHVLLHVWCMMLYWGGGKE